MGYLTTIQIMSHKLPMIQNMMSLLCVRLEMLDLFNKIIRIANRSKKYKIRRSKKLSKKVPRIKLLQGLSKVQICIGGFTSKLFILELIKTFRYRKIQD